MDKDHLGDKFVAFVDIIGFESMVRNAESGGVPSFAELLSATTALGGAETQARYEKDGFNLCPCAPHMSKNLDFKITQISDCAVISTEVSPAGLINLLSHCATTCMKLMSMGFMCRGYITKGIVYHANGQIVGSGYMDAAAKEKNVSVFKQAADERGTPFIEIDTELVQYVANQPDDCVKKIFDRLVKTDGLLTAIFPFKRLNHSFIIADFGIKFDAEKERQSIRNVKKWILDFKQKIADHIDQSNPSAVQKGQHYIRALDAQLLECEKTERVINRLTAPFPA
jgi:hypothetical protein